MPDSIRIGARLRAARKAAGFKTSKNFIRKFKIPQSTYSQHESGARSMDDDTIKHYCKLLGVYFDWLKSGEGLPFRHLKNEQKLLLREELLDIGPKIKSNQLLQLTNQVLLVKILEELLKIHNTKKRKIRLNKIVSDAVGIYADIISSGESEGAQLKMLLPALNAYKRFASI